MNLVDTDRRFHGRFNPNREPSGRNMIGKELAKALYWALTQHRELKAWSTEKLLAEIRLGHGTFLNLKQGCSVTQQSALKVVKYLGTSTRAVLLKYQQREI